MPSELEPSSCEVKPPTFELKALASRLEPPSFELQPLTFCRKVLTSHGRATTPYRQAAISTAKTQVLNNLVRSPAA